MRKDEAVHLHALFGELQHYVESHGWVRSEAFAEYDRLGISPLQIHRQKGKHERALVVLAETLANELASNSKYADESELPREPVALRSEDR